MCHFMPSINYVFFLNQNDLFEKKIIQHIQTLFWFVLFF